MFNVGLISVPTIEPKDQYEPGVWRALDEHGGYAVSPGRPRVGHLEALLLPLPVLPLRLLVQLQLVLACNSGLVDAVHLNM